MSDDEEFNRREVAWRLFASEFRDADYSYAESDEERAPNYVVTPTGARVNRLFVVGVLTEVEYVSDDYLRARIVDPTGAFVVYAGQYQPEALTFLESAETPTFVAVTGKARTFQPEDSDIVYTSIRPEAISEVDATTRDNWVVTTAEQTIERIATMADALDLVERGDDLRAVLEARNVPPSLAAGITLAIDHYGTTEHYLAATRDLALDAARVVSGDRDEVRQQMVDPSDTSDEPVAVGLDDFTLATGDAQPEPTTPDTEDTDTGETDADVSEGDDDSSTEDLEATADAQAAEADSTPTPKDDTDVEPDPETATVGADGSTETSAGDTAAPTAETDTDSVSTDTESTSTETQPADTETESTEASEAEAADAEPEAVTDEMYELSEEERQEVEENYDVGFSTADEVEGEAGIEPEAPQPDAEADSETDADADADAGVDTAADTEPESSDDESVEDLAFDASESDTGGDEGAAEETDSDDDVAAAEEAASDDDEEAAADVDPDADLEDVVVETMQALGDGDGAPHDAIVEAVVDSHGVDADAVEEAIQDALMSGRCYESGEDEFTAI